MGEYSYRDVVKEDGIPAIVPKELFERVQERLAKNKKAPARHKAEDDYLLTTKLYCGKCGSFMVGESGTSHTMKVHRYYRCVNTKKKKLCDKKAVKKDWIEDLVVSYTMKAIMNDEVMERLIDTLMELQKRESTDLPLLKKQLAETEKGINNMLNAIQAGIFTPSTKQRLDELEETKSQLEISILQEEMHKPMLTREQIAFFIYRFRKFDVTKREQRQRLIDSFVNAVYLYEDKIILTFNYKDGSKTITLAEVEGSDLSVLGAVSKDVKKHRDSLYLLGFPVLSIFLFSCPPFQTAFPGPFLCQQKFPAYFLPMIQKLLQTGGMIMAKAGMRRPNPYDADNHGTENHHKMNRPENKQAQVPEIQGAAKNGNAKAGPIHAPNWARDDYKTGDHE